MPAIRVINIEADHPTVDKARRLISEEIKRAKCDGVRDLKMISSLKGNWTPLDIQLFTAEVAILQRTTHTPAQVRNALICALSWIGWVP